MGNPFSLGFGKYPLEAIDRPVQKEEILDAFCSTPINQQIFLITGIRGCGKTVLLTEVSKQLKNDDGWIVISLNPELDMLHSLAAKLSALLPLADLYRRANINLSLLGLGVSIDGIAPIADDETAITRMLEVVKKKGLRVLITVDEVVNNPSMRAFAASFQMFIRDDLSVFLLMTGLFENVNSLQNEKSLTFLLRAPKIQLNPLNLGAIARRYQNLFHLSNKEAAQMAAATKGYAFAFQALGFLTYRDGKESYRRVLPDYRQYLEEFVYEKLWSEMSEKDRALALAVAHAEDTHVMQVRTLMNVSSPYFERYKKRLVQKGILETPSRGVIAFVLPMFREFVLDKA